MTVTMFAYDRHGDPVTDLRAEDIRVRDAGREQPVTSLHLNQGHQRQPVIVLFDLLNSRMAGREMVKNEITHSLQHLESSDNLYVYILTKRATVYPIHGLEEFEAAPLAPGVSWIQALGPTLDRALSQLMELRPTYMEDPDFRLQATLQGFSNLAAHISSLSGRKSIIWISHGVPIDVTLYSDSYAASIPRLCSHLVSDSITVYAVHESNDVSPQLDSEDFLEEFTSLTGGMTFPTDATELAITQALSDDRVNYSITYLSDGVKNDGKFHKIQLKCRQPGVRLRTIRGYYAVSRLAN